MTLCRYGQEGRDICGQLSDFKSKQTISISPNVRQIKHVKCVCCVDQLSSVQPITSVHTVAQNVAVSLVGHSQLVPQPVPSIIAQFASSTAPVFQTPQPPYQISHIASSEHPTLVLSASNWDSTPQTGEQGYISPLIDFYPKQDSYLEALYKDNPADQEVLSYEDILDAPSSSEADPAEWESIRSEDQSYRKTVHAVRSYMQWSFIPELEYVCSFHQDNP